MERVQVDLLARAVRKMFEIEAANGQQPHTLAQIAYARAARLVVEQLLDLYFLPDIPGHGSRREGGAT